MSLLMMEQNPEFNKLTSEIYACQLENDQRLREELDDRARQKMYQDVRYNVDFLYTALKLQDDGLFGKYARWIYQLLCPLMNYCSRERVRDIMVEHYELIRTCMGKHIPREQHPKLNRLLDCAVRATIEESERSTLAAPFKGKYEGQVEEYLGCLLQSDTKGAMSLITQYVKDGIPLNDIYVEIVTETMRRIGDLWHRHIISVDMEHYSTSITQMALAQLYPFIFGQKRKGHLVLVACVGSELHELGARTVADIFEYNGWDSIYLGAAVPVEALESAIAEYSPDLIALSVTMPQHLPLCREAIDKLRELFPRVRIAVGGNAFLYTDIWKEWNVDIYTRDARELIKWAEKEWESVR
ncbi:cobalamin-dependent protein [Blautia schinkii]|nr:cobalamin-dependent protein [Blautia schinkii]